MSSHSERISEQSAAPVQIPIYPTGGSERYSSHSEHFSQKAAPVQIPIYPTGGSERFSR